MAEIIKAGMDAEALDAADRSVRTTVEAILERVRR